MGLGSFAALADTTIDDTNRFAYAANLGWWDGCNDTNHGVVIGEYVCSGYIYSVNVGWISLGNGSPINQIQYQTNSAAEFGVNQDGSGNLSGYAYGANIGWVTFEQTYGKPRVNLRTGELSGCVYSANCGWISLSNAVAYVKTDRIQSGPLAPNGLPIAWLLQNFGTTNVDASGDADEDGASNASEYLAGTDPNTATSVLRITAENFDSGGTSASLVWNSIPTRFYYIEKTTSLASLSWIDSGLSIIPPDSGISTFRTFTDTNTTARYYRVKAIRPLMP